MRLDELHTIRLKTVTPVFVGNGENIKPLSYVLEGDTAHIINESKFFASLSTKERDCYIAWIEPLLDQLTQLDEQIALARDHLERRRKLQRERRAVESKLALSRFLSDQLRVNPVRFIQERGAEAYRVRCNIPPERDGFRLHLKDPASRPYLPGTEIKGAFRTALLYALVSDPANYSYFRHRLEEFRRFFRSGAPPREKLRRLTKIAEAVEAELLRGKPKGEAKNDAKFDFLRFLHVSDSSFLSPDNLRVELTQMLGTNRYTKTWVESLAAGYEVITQLAIGDPMLILQELGLERLRGWLSLPKLLEACYRRSYDILAEEAIYFADEPKLHALVTLLQNQNTIEAPLLRLGQGQGFLSITVNLPVKRRDPELFDEAIREGVSFQRRFRTQRCNFPKTRRVIVDAYGSPVSTLGWVKILLINDSHG
jgi:CRISPR type III-A-associated RAMP protein Csm5